MVANNVEANYMEETVTLEAVKDGKPRSASQVDAHSAQELNAKYRWLILFALVISAILEVMDSSILNVALPQMAGTLGTTMNDIAWVSTAYLLANVVVLPMSAWLAQRFGRKPYLLISILLFTIARLLCAFSPSLGLVIVWRLVQGAAGAALIATSQAVIADIFPKKQQGMVQSLFGLGLVVAPAVAPLLGGWIVEQYNWQLIFYVHLPVALVSLGLIWRLFTDNSTQESRTAAGKLDGLGVVFLAMGLGSLQYVLEEGQRNDWFNDTTITSFATLSVIGIIALIVWELHPANKSPVVNLRVYANPSLAAAVVISFAVGIGIYGVNLIFAVLVQNILGYTAIKSGMALVPMGVGSLISLAIVAAVSNKVDARLLIVCGLVIGGIGAWMLGFNTLDTDIPDTWIGLGMVGFGIGGSVMPVTIAALGALRPSESGDGAAQLGLGRQLGGSFGIALLNTYISHMSDFNRCYLVERINTANSVFTQTWQGLVGYMAIHGHSLTDAQRMALHVIDLEISLQSVLKAYNSAFQIVAVVFISCNLLVLLLKKSKATGNMPVGH